MCVHVQMMISLCSLHRWVEASCNCRSDNIDIRDIHTDTRSYIADQFPLSPSDCPGFGVDRM